MTISQLITDSYTTAREKGWHDSPRTFGDRLSLIHSEVSEALEDYRNGYLPNQVFYTQSGKPCGVPIELADVLIRIFDMCGELDIDLEAALKIKSDYNRTRPHRHGGKVL
jgi:NTP pyrophosphatase (non-canonical NTP hydrolase)